MPEIIASTYEIIEKLGAGGGGTVFLANHLRLGKQVVLKADKRKISTRPELLRREVDILKELKHPYIPNVYDFFVEGNLVCTVMDYIQGESLDKPLKRGEKFSQPQVIRWGKQLLEALCYLHSPTHGTPPRGFVHSDIKPANLMRTPDNDICLIDFNIALALGEETVIGCSAGYASPEHYGLDFSTDGDTQSTEQRSPSGKGWTLPWKRRTGTGEGDTLPWKRRVEEDGDDTLPWNGRTEADEDQTLSGYGRDGGEESRTLPWSEQTEAGETDIGVQETDMANPISGRTDASPAKLMSASRKKVIIPDVRSDIYSAGATLYHLLKGKCPAKNAWEVVPLSEKEFSPQVVKIISKAMNPNPDLRYQTAEEMLHDLSHLRENDVRVRRQKRSRLVAGITLSALFAFGASAAFVGLKRMQTTERWLKLAEYSKNALAEGDLASALDYALQAMPEKLGNPGKQGVRRTQRMQDILVPAYVPEAQRALAGALRVYDLSDGYKSHGAVGLPSAPLSMAIAPDGRTAACVYAYSVAVFDTDSGEIFVTLPMEESALSEVEYLDGHTIVFAGKGGVRAYDIEEGKELWAGKSATSVCVSGDGKTVAAVYKDEPFATVYGAHDGQVRHTVDFGGKCQQVTANDSFANPNSNLLALNQQGTLLGVSFADGSLQVYNLANPEGDMVIFDETSGYFHFEGGFYQQYFAFSATQAEESVFAVVDTVDMAQTGGFQSESAFSVQTDGGGIYVQTENLLVRIHPVTGEQTPLVTTAESIQRYARGGTHTLIATEGQLQFFDRNASLTSSHEEGFGGNFLQIANGTALVGSGDSPSIRVMKHESHPEAEVFAYDPSYGHDEARLSGDGSTVMLFSYGQFRLYGIGGELIKEVSIPNAGQVYDQQYVRDGGQSWLEVIYNDGTVLAYSAKDGNLMRKAFGEKPDLTLYEEFFTDCLRVESPLHGQPSVYDRETGRLVRQLGEDAYLTYVTQAGEYVVIQYVTTEGYCYGQLLDGDCQVLADLPYLCDIIGDTLYFDYPTGNMRKARIYDIDELVTMAREQLQEGGS